MERRATLYIATTCLTAAAIGVWIYFLDPAISRDAVTAALWLSVLGLLSSFVMHETGRGTTGSIAFLPFMAAVLLSPTWMTLLAATAATAIGQLVGQKVVVKRVFNIAQHAAAIGIAILVYRVFGGTAMAIPQQPSYIAGTLACAAFLAVNTLAVSGVIAISQRDSILVIWRQVTVRSLGPDLLSFPIVFFLALAYLHFGPLGAVALSIPLVGVRQLYKYNWQLEQGHQELLRLMVAAMEARDPYTSGHSKRVARNAGIIARALRLGRKQAERVGVAALLHDVGKIHEVFAPILRKADGLTEDEWTIIRTHPIKSAELVAMVSELKDVVAPIRHHHERWDGHGYPDGLAGEDIPFAARIINLADAIDAMTTERPYRTAIGEDAVRAEIAREKGKQFDPAICDALLASVYYGALFPGEGPSRLTVARVATVAGGRLP